MSEIKKSISTQLLISPEEWTVQFPEGPTTKLGSRHTESNINQSSNKPITGINYILGNALNATYFLNFFINFYKYSYTSRNCVF